MPDFHKIYENPLDAECCEGYFDGRRPESPEPSGNRHPAYIHGFKNGRDDLMTGNGTQKFSAKTAQEKRDDWAYIVAAFSE